MADKNIIQLGQIPKAMLEQAVDLSDGGKIYKIILSSRFVSSPPLYAEHHEVATNGSVIMINEAFSCDSQSQFENGPVPPIVRHREVQVLNIPAVMMLCQAPQWWSRRKEAELPQ